MKYLSIDVETTGLKNDNNQLLEMGCVLEDTMKDTPVDELPYFRAILIEPSGEYKISTYVMRMHSSLFEEIDQVKRDLLEKHGGFYYIEGNSLSESQAVYCYAKHLDEAFTIWCKRNGVFTDKGKIIAAGKNFFGFDYGFLEPWLLNTRFHRRALDPVMYYIKDTDQKPPNLELCCERADIELTGYHTAVGDARTVVKLIRKGRS